ncbi:Uncharacterized protein Adt_12061 [Abeliophyllum distichum]|uniref:Uncharacterized protein n=1 Tax=Abeliophyllum distichum TaxID=126358 RepID=A0ABD1UPN6_9LAMI
MELKAKKTQYVTSVNEKESLYYEIDKAKSSFDEISSEVMVEDSLMMSLAAQIKKIQAKMDDCKARLLLRNVTPPRIIKLDNTQIHLLKFLKDVAYVLNTQSPAHQN